MAPDLELTTPPTAELLTLDQAKAHLKVDANDDDNEIQAAIAAAVAHLDGYAGQLGRALAPQTWTLYLDRFPCGAGSLRDPRRRPGNVIRLPLPPLISVDSIHYLDSTGVTQTLGPSAYQVLAGERAEVWPAYGTTWPGTRCQPRAVAIAFTCGFGPAGDWPRQAAARDRSPEADRRRHLRTSRDRHRPGPSLTRSRCPPR
jgi:uncharacterized phiE125 gp8 family phage protein